MRKIRGGITKAVTILLMVSMIISETVTMGTIVRAEVIDSNMPVYAADLTENPELSSIVKEDTNDEEDSEGVSSNEENESTDDSKLENTPNEEVGDESLPKESGDDLETDGDEAEEADQNDESDDNIDADKNEETAENKEIDENEGIDKEESEDADIFDDEEQTEEEIEEGEIEASEEALEAVYSYYVSVGAGKYKVGTSVDNMGTSLKINVSSSDEVKIYFLVNKGYEFKGINVNRPADVGTFSCQYGGKVVDGINYNMVVFNASLFKSDIIVTPVIERKIDVINVSGQYKIEGPSGQKEDNLSGFSRFVSNETDYSFKLYPNQGYIITGVKYQINNGTQTALAPVETTENGIWKMTIPKSRLTGDISLYVTAERLIDLNIMDGISVKVLNGTARLDKAVKGRYYLDDTKCNGLFRFNVICKETVTPKLSIGGKAINYTSYTYSSAGQYTYLYEVSIASLGTSTEGIINAEKSSARTISMNFDSNEVDVEVRVGGGLINNSTDNKCIVEAGQTAYLRITPHNNTKIEKIEVYNEDSKTTKVLKYASEIAFKPMESCKVSVQCKSVYATVICEYDPALCLSLSEMTVVKPVNGVVTLSPYLQYISYITKGSGLIPGQETTGISIKSGKQEFNDMLIGSSVADGSAFLIDNLQNYSGKTYVLNRTVTTNKGTQSFSTKLKVLSYSNMIKSVTLGGKKEISQVTGEVVTYKVNITPSDIDWSSVWPEGKKGVEIVSYNPTDKTISVKLKPSETIKSDFTYGEICFHYISIDSNGEQIIGHIPGGIKVYEKRNVLENSTPIVSVAYTTDRKICLKLTVPNGIDITDLKYIVKIEPDGDDSDLKANSNMISFADYSTIYNVKTRTQYCDITMTKDSELPSTPHKYKISVRMSRSIGVTVYDNPYISKEKIIYASTKPKKLGSGISVTNIKSSIYADKIINEQRYTVAKLKFSSQVSVRDFYCRTDKENVSAEIKLQNDGTMNVDVYSRASSVKSVKPGIMNLKIAYNDHGSGDYRYEKTIQVKILPYITSMNIEAPTQVYIPGGKNVTIQPRVANAQNSAGEEVKKVSVVWELCGLSDEQKKYISINPKTGKITINKRYVLGYGKSSDNIAVLAKATDIDATLATGELVVISLNRNRIAPKDLHIEGSGVTLNDGGVYSGATNVGMKVIALDESQKKIDPLSLKYTCQTKGVTVDSYGKLTFAASFKGKVTITVTSTDLSNVSKKISFTIK